MSTKITFPIGRLLWGSLYTPETKDYEGNPLIIKTGPDAGKATQKYSFGVAIPKEAGKGWWETVWGKPIYDEGLASFPRGEAQHKDFAWKITDGDSTEMKRRGTKPINQLTGYAGHWVLAFSSTFPPKLYTNNGQEQLTQPDAIKCGYYIQVAGSVAGNGNTSNPGVYLNHELVNLSGYGEEIYTGADPLAAGFGGALPPGASATPVAGSFAPAGYTGPAAGPGAMPAPSTPGAAPAVPHTPAPAPAPMPAPAPVVRPVLVQIPGAQYTIESCRAAGWTDEQLVTNGVARWENPTAGPAPAPAGVTPVPSFLHGPQA